MNKYRFQFLVVIMSLSLLGIILIQLYWINTSYENNEKQFRYTVNQVLSNVAEKVQSKEKFDFYRNLQEYKNATGKTPDRKDIKEIFYIERDTRTNDEIIYSNKVYLEDFNLKGSFFDTDATTSSLKNYSSKRKVEIFNGDKATIDQQGQVAPRTFSDQSQPDMVIEKEGDLDIGYELMYYDLMPTKPIEERVNSKMLEELLRAELAQNGVDTSFEYGLFSNGLSTPIASPDFLFNESNTYSVALLPDIDNHSKYQLYVSFPFKSKYLYSDLLPFILISLLFTSVIIAAYYSAISQLRKQRQISEIKNDFINNMTHEFKTPIATINLALDAIKNPKIINDEEKVKRYTQM